MLGEIVSYDPEKKLGSIRNGKESFEFTLDNWRPEVPPEAGDEVKFDIRVNKAVNVDLLANFVNKLDTAVKSRYLAAFLSLFLGWAGVHRFYLGYYQMGIVQILVTALLITSGMMGFAMLWGFVEAFLLFGGHMDRDAKGRPLK